MRQDMDCGRQKTTLVLLKKRKMENTEMENEEMWRKFEKRHRRGRILGGLLLLTIGGLFLAREAGAGIPTWFFTWKMLLIGLGIMMAFKHKFMHPAWLILIAIGGGFLLGDLYPELEIKRYILPVVLIAVGLFVIFRPRDPQNFRYRYWKKWQRHGRRGCHPYEPGASGTNGPQGEKEDYIDSTAFMAGVKKNIVTKDFRGGEVTSVFGGTELNFMQADIEGSATLELTTVLAGTKLIVPSNWEIKPELVTVLGGVEDKRPVQSGLSSGSKILRLTGTTFLGGIEISTY
jgi:hypothetical protein